MSRQQGAGTVDCAHSPTSRPGEELQQQLQPNKLLAAAQSNPQLPTQHEPEAQMLPSLLLPGMFQPAFADKLEVLSPRAALGFTSSHLQNFLAVCGAAAPPSQTTPAAPSKVSQPSPGGGSLAPHQCNNPGNSTPTHTVTYGPSMAVAATGLDACLTTGRDRESLGGQAESTSGMRADDGARSTIIDAAMSCVGTAAAPPAEAVAACGEGQEAAEGPATPKLSLEQWLKQADGLKLRAQKLWEVEQLELQRGNELAILCGGCSNTCDIEPGSAYGSGEIAFGGFSTPFGGGSGAAPFGGPYHVGDNGFGGGAADGGGGHAAGASIGDVHMDGGGGAQLASRDAMAVDQSWPMHTTPVSGSEWRPQSQQHVPLQLPPLPINRVSPANDFELPPMLRRPPNDPLRLPLRKSGSMRRNGTRSSEIPPMSQSLKRANSLGTVTLPILPPLPTDIPLSSKKAGALHRSNSTGGSGSKAGKGRRNSGGAGQTIAQLKKGAAKAQTPPVTRNNSFAKASLAAVEQAEEQLAPRLTRGRIQAMQQQLLLNMQVKEEPVDEPMLSQNQQHREITAEHHTNDARHSEQVMQQQQQQQIASQLDELECNEMSPPSPDPHHHLQQHLHQRGDLRIRTDRQQHSPHPDHQSHNLAELHADLLNSPRMHLYSPRMQLLHQMHMQQSQQYQEQQRLEAERGHQQGQEDSHHLPLMQTLVPLRMGFSRPAAMFDDAMALAEVQSGSWFGMDDPGSASAAVNFFYSNGQLPFTPTTARAGL